MLRNSRLLQSLMLSSLSLAGLIGAFAYADSFYRWTDAEGVIHYGDKRPQQPTNDKTKRLRVSSQREASSPVGLRPGELEMLRNLEEEAKAPAQPEPAKAGKSDEDTEPTPEELCTKYSNLLKESNPPQNAREKARQELRSGNWAAAHSLRRGRLRRELRQDYQAQVDQYCQTK